MKDFLASPEIENIFENSDFLVLLSQAQGDRQILAKQLGISPHQLSYAKPLTEKQMEDYELKPAPGNPDRVCPSITARLKDGTRGQEPPKEPGQKRSHKNHEER